MKQHFLDRSKVIAEYPVTIVLQISICGICICSDNDQLLCLLYERIEVPSGDPFPHFWTYRVPFTLAHLVQTLQNKDTSRKFPILHEFLREVSGYHLELWSAETVNNIFTFFQMLGSKLEGNTIYTRHCSVAAVPS